MKNSLRMQQVYCCKSEQKKFWSIYFVIFFQSLSCKNKNWVTNFFDCNNKDRKWKGKKNCKQGLCAGL